MGQLGLNFAFWSDSQLCCQDSLYTKAKKDGFKGFLSSGSFFIDDEHDYPEEVQDLDQFILQIQS